MNRKNLPLVHYYSWQNVSDSMIPNIMAEFSWHGVSELVITSTQIQRMISEPRFWGILNRHLQLQGMKFTEAHGIYGQEYDIVCTDKARRPGMIADHKLAMAYSAECGCRTYTIHIGAYESVFYRTPNSELRPLGVDALEQLLPEAEKLGIILAVENSFERSNTPDEVAYYIEYFNSPYIRCCYDSGHANIMAPAPGKRQELYIPNMQRAWGGFVEEYPDALARLAPYIVTCHLHDNNSYGDDHAMPGTGTINWPELMSRIHALPALLSIQTEILTAGIPVARLVEDGRRYFSAC